MLLDHGADLKAIDSTGETALYSAARNKHLDALEYFMSQSPDNEWTSNLAYNGHSPFHMAARSYNAEGCEFFLKHGASVKRRTSSPFKATPLILAAWWSDSCTDSQARTIQVLLDHGANITEEFEGLEMAGDLEIRRRRRVLQVAALGELHVTENLDPYTNDRRYVLMRHVVKMEYMNLSISEDDRRIIEYNICYKGYYEFCKEELEKMKETKIYNGVSIFNILMGDTNFISRCAIHM